MKLTLSSGVRIRNHCLIGRDNTPRKGGNRKVKLGNGIKRREITVEKVTKLQRT